MEMHADVVVHVLQQDVPVAPGVTRANPHAHVFAYVRLQAQEKFRAMHSLVEKAMLGVHSDPIRTRLHKKTAVLSKNRPMLSPFPRKIAISLLSSVCEKISTTTVARIPLVHSKLRVL